MTAQNNSKIVSDGTALRTFLYWAALAYIVIAFYVALQVGHLWGEGEWLRGGVNPGAALFDWAKDGVVWPGWFFVLFGIAMLLLVGMFVATVEFGNQRREKAGKVDGMARYLGRGEDLTEATVRESAIRHKLVAASGAVGLRLAQVLQTGSWIYAGWRDGFVAIMGTGSGKTTGLVIPIILDAPGPVWATTNRPDVYAAVRGPRSEMGTVYGYDLQGVASLKPWFLWNPLSYLVGDKADVRAYALAKQFAESGRPLDARTDAFFDPAGQELLGYLLLAAKVAGEPITVLFKWLSRPKQLDPVEILETAGWDIAAESLRGKYELPEKTRGSIFETARLLIKFMDSRAARPWFERTGPDDDRPEFDPHAFVRSSDTMVCMSREGMGSMAPLVAALTLAVIEAAEDYAKVCKGGRLSVPFVVAGDEAANVCRIREMPNIMSHAGGRGIFIGIILQSRAQGEEAWGERNMEKMWGAAVIRILGRGLSEMKLLRDASDEIGLQDVKRTDESVSRGRGGGSRSVSQRTTQEPILPASAIAKLPEWRALVFAAGHDPVVARIVPYFEREEMAAAVQASQDEYEREHVA